MTALGQVAVRNPRQEAASAGIRGRHPSHNRECPSSGMSLEATLLPKTLRITDYRAKKRRFVNRRGGVSVTDARSSSVERSLPGVLSGSN